MTDFEPEYPPAGWGGAAGSPGSSQGYPPPPQTSQPQSYAQTDNRQQPHGYQQQGYGPPPYGPPPIRSTNTMAVLAIVFAFVFAPLGIVFGVMARNQIRQTGEDGAALALLGIVISIAVIVLSVFAIVLAVLVLGTAVDTFNEIDIPTPPPS